MKKVVNSILPISRSKRLGQQMLKTLKLDLNSIEEFYILLDNPHKTFKPGEEVCGQVILILKKNLPNVLITLSLIGLIKLIGSGSTFRSTKKTTLFNHTINLYGNVNLSPPPIQQSSSSNNDNMEIETNISNPGLTKGEHHFPFIVKLPKKNIYTSVTFEKGEIRYSLKASISDSYFSNNNNLNSPTISSLNSSLNNNRNSNSNSNSSKTSLTRNNLLNLNNNTTTNSDSSNTLSNDINNIANNNNNTLTSSSITGNGTSNQRYSNDLNNNNNKSILTCEKYISIIKPINLSLLPESQPKILVFKVPKKGLKKTISSTSTVNSQLSSYSQDFTIMTPNSNNNYSPEDDSNNQPNNNNQNNQNLIGSAAVSITSSTHSSSENDNLNTVNEDTQKVAFASPLTDSNNNNNESEISNKLNFQQQPSQSQSSTPTTRIANDIKLSVYTPSMGYLRGEIVPVKINVQHYKKFKSPTGIIVTLIRICRIDQGTEHAIQSFRKDLSQSIVPLFLSPNKFQYEVTTSLKIPLDCFPTIVGSNMVSFQYYIEVIVNLSNSKAILNQNKTHLDSGMDDEDIYDVTSLNDTSSPSNTTNQPSGQTSSSTNTNTTSTTQSINANTSINSNNSSVLNINDSGIINDHSYNGGIYNDNDNNNNNSNITNNNSNENSFDYFSQISNSNNNSNLNSPNNINITNGNLNNIGSSGNWINNLDNSSNNRNNIFNVDKLKRAKHVLTLLNEIIIGTERKPISKLRRSNKNKIRHGGSSSNQHGIISNSNSSTTSTGPSLSTVSMTPMTQQQVTPVQQVPIQQVPIQQVPIQQVVPVQRQSSRVINKIEDNNVNNSIDSSPSPINSIPNSPNVLNSPSDSNIIDNNVNNLNNNNLPSQFINIPNFDNNLTEKQNLKLREEALLPSEPIILTNENNENNENNNIGNNSNSLPEYIPLPIQNNINNNTNNIEENRSEQSGDTNESNGNTNNSENTIRMIDILRTNNQEFINNNDFLPAYQEYSQKDS
ncbi:hypothetical protein B5S28_g3582 [[Candida] boidinii]|nr:hypothetical protein B5S28_g3582 [[Candida] boidinii]